VHAAGAKSHQHGVTILSAGGGFSLSTLVAMNDNEMKGPWQSCDALGKKKETGKDMKCRIDLCHIDPCNGWLVSRSVSRS
jgi:hypothetical protein